MNTNTSQSSKNPKFVIRKRRVFSEVFKREQVAKLVSGELSIAQLAKNWQIATKTAYQWLYTYSPQHTKGTIMVVQQDSEATKTQQLLQQIAQLERALGQKQLIIDYQDKLMELASKELQVDLKKTFAHQP